MEKQVFKSEVQVYLRYILRLYNFDMSISILNSSLILRAKTSRPMLEPNWDDLRLFPFRIRILSIYETHSFIMACIYEVQMIMKFDAVAVRSINSQLISCAPMKQNSVSETFKLSAMPI